ncbi:MAG: hypothetical protein D6728_12455 [Cyanobacteria bacterium J055]|nr:MAG: hypothetical protein D6728_12455 [Cyanobacteria bacterium J055]
MLEPFDLEQGLLWKMFPKTLALKYAGWHAVLARASFRVPERYTLSEIGSIFDALSILDLASISGMGALFD